MRNTLRILAFDVAPPLAAIAGAGVHRHRARLAAVVGVGVFGAMPAHRRGCRGQRRTGAPRRSHRRHRRRRAKAAAGGGRGRDGDAGGGGGRRLPELVGARPRSEQRHRGSGRHRHQRRRGLRDVHPAEPHRVDRPGHGDDVSAKRGGVQEGIRLRGKRFGEPENHGSGQHHIGGRRGDRARRPPASR